MEQSLTARNSAERLAASSISNREDPRFLDTIYPFSICYSMVCRFERGVVARTIGFESLSLTRSALTLEASVVLSGRAVSENLCICGRCLFREGGL